MYLRFSASKTYEVFAPEQRAEHRDRIDIICTPDIQLMYASGFV